MKTKNALWAVILVVCSLFLKQAPAQSSYAQMAPLPQYQMQRQAEIELARSAAPSSISSEAQILILGQRGFEQAVAGKNGFVCLVQRSWAAGVDDPEFWNPKVRAPICVNTPAAHSILLHITRKAEWALQGLSKDQIRARIKDALQSGQFPRIEPEAMSYMMSKDGHLNDRDGHWHPHLMFFTSPTDPANWGANLKESPVLAATSKTEEFTVFLLPVANWSDGTPGPPMD